jgi:hypothetical protein
LSRLRKIELKGLGRADWLAFGREFLEAHGESQSARRAANNDCR